MGLDAVQNFLDQKFFGKWIPLNKEFFVIRKKPDVVSFDTYPKRDGESEGEKQLTNSELMLLLYDGLRKLGEKLENDPGYLNVARITCTSWIVTLRPDGLEYLGFTIDKEGTDPLGQEFIQSYKKENKWGLYPIDPKYQDIEPMFASIDRDTFLAKYGPKPASDAAKA